MTTAKPVTATPAYRLFISSLIVVVGVVGSVADRTGRRAVDNR
jgi:hypothetical protein